jgi:hypothetical protein
VGEERRGRRCCADGRGWDGIESSKLGKIVDTARKQLHSSKRDCKDPPLTDFAGTATAALSYGSQDTDALSTDWLHKKDVEGGSKRLGWNRSRDCCCT